MGVEDWYKAGDFAVVDDLSVFYRRSGSGTTLLCIHGFPSSSWDFESIWPSLVARFDVIAHDLIGLGKSSKPKRPLTVALQADIIEKLLVQQGATAAHILAHDLGDTVAQELLARQRDKSSGINWLSCVFLNGGLFPETHRPLLTQKLLVSPAGPLIARLMSERTLGKSFRSIFSKAHPPNNEFIHETWKLISDNGGVAMIPRLIRYMKERVRNRERWVTPLAENIVPLRLINGVDDPISGKHAADRYAEIVPNADIVLIRLSGHYPHAETPDEVLKAFFDFHDCL